ncbi:MAG TPA: metalloregulator ArsR/SmtB family transcription factor [Rhodocyclaceae bacterium]|nr:metalloregulator ArsR/SmtB family transcription factor [Rhodocyclaceae bacterium]
MKTNDAVVALGALAQETRLSIYRLLVQAGEGGLVVGRLAEALEVEANGRLTFHLKALVQAGLIEARPEGRFIYYAARYQTMNDLLAFLTENCCGGADCGEAVVCPPEHPKLRKS